MLPSLNIAHLKGRFIKDVSEFQSNLSSKEGKVSHYVGCSLSFPLEGQRERETDRERERERRVSHGHLSSNLMSAGLKDERREKG